MREIQKYLSVIAVSIVLAAIAAVVPASAQVEFLLDKSLYIQNHKNQLVQTFAAGKAAPGGFETCNQPENEFSNDDCFDPGDILPGLEFVALPINLGVVFLAGVNSQGGANPNQALARGGGAGTFEVQFVDGVNSAGMDIGCLAEGGPCNSMQTVRLIDIGGNTIDSIQVKVDDFFNTFVGFNSVVPVARVNISGPENLSQGVDEVRFGSASNPIPTLSEWGMIAAAAGLALVGVFFAVKRRSMSKA